jgi:hypothetical protein
MGCLSLLMLSPTAGPTYLGKYTRSIDFPTGLIARQAILLAALAWNLPRSPAPALKAEATRHPVALRTVGLNRF